MGVFAHHGFQNVAEKINLGRFSFQNSKQDIESHSAPERVRMSFEQLGPTFVKLGQLLSTRPDLIPSEFVEEFKKLRSDVQTLDFEEIKPTLEEHFGDEFQKNFRVFDEVPLASASIAQVHRATLSTGDEVVVKIQRPGIVETINEDLGVLYQIAHLLEKYIPELEAYDPVGIVDEFFKTLQLETNFIVEANNLRRFSENFSDDDEIKIPDVYMELSGPKVLVMEALKGKPLSRVSDSYFEGIDRQKVTEASLRCYFEMVFKHGFFHGDLHAGNFFVLPDQRIGLIDFGIVGRLNKRTQDAIANMLMAMAIEDYERVAYEYVDLAPYTENLDVERFAKDLRDLVSPYYGLSMKNVNTGKLLMDSAAMASKHRIKVPSELMLYFKSMVGIESLGKELMEDFDFLDQALAFAKDLAVTRYEPKRIFKDLFHFSQDSKNFLYDLPRQLRQLMKKVSSPGFVPKIHIENSDEIVRTLSNSGDLTFMGLIISGLLISGSLSLDFQTQITVFGVPLISAVFFALAGFYGLIAFFKYIRK